MQVFMKLLQDVERREPSGQQSSEEKGTCTVS